MEKLKRKPRTNDDAAWYWAQSMLADEPPSSIDVNSVGVGTRRIPYGRAETGEQLWVSHTRITSFGWYPMGVIVRDPDGRVVRVVTNRDQYPSKGYASTPTDQGSVDRWARDAVSELNRHRPKSRRIKVEDIPLTGTHLYYHDGPNDHVPSIPREDDPKPPDYRREIPRVFRAPNPGPEPVDDGVGCIAGRVEWYEYEDIDWISGEKELAAQDQAYVLASEPGGYRMPQPGDFIIEYSSEYSSSLKAHRAGVDTITWVTNDPHTARHDQGLTGTVKRCPHCERFDARHRDWKARMHGGYDSHWNKHKGYALRCELLGRYGDEEGWREEWRRQGKREYAARKARSEWVKRNFIPFESVGLDEWGIPRLRDGYALRKDSDLYFACERAKARRERQRQRQAEAAARERERIEKFKERVRRARQDPFIVSAQNVANTLAQIGNRNDSQEN